MSTIADEDLFFQKRSYFNPNFFGTRTFCSVGLKKIVKACKITNGIEVNLTSMRTQNTIHDAASAVFINGSVEVK